MFDSTNSDRLWNAGRDDSEPRQTEERNRETAQEVERLRRALETAKLRTAEATHRVDQLNRQAQLLDLRAQQAEHQLQQEKLDVERHAFETRTVIRERDLALSRVEALDGHVEAFRKHAETAEDY